METRPGVGLYERRGIRGVNEAIDVQELVV